ncbi:MAG: hypothetical protein IJN51_01850 [Alistipes sp.]|nr:hypothetical protein [Alistipes sp.]
MKKLLALALVVFGLAACQTEPEGLDVNMGGEQEVMLTVSLPEATRANSANGFQIADLGSTYDLRYILEVYRADDEGNILYENCQRQVKLADAATMSFPVRLAPEYNYQIVAWADIVDNGSYNDRIYKTDNGLDAVEIIESMWKPMDETRDAYTAVKVVNDFNSSSNLDMTLTRPFAKLRVVATDIDDIRKVGLEPTSATVEYSQDMYFKYNAVADIENEGAANDAREKSHNISYPATPVYNDATGEYTLFADYIFVPESGTAKFLLNVYADANGSKLIKDNNFNTEISVERNKLTTIKGDVLTIGGDVKVTVDNELGVKEVINIVDTANSLIDAINGAEPGKETNIELGGDIDLGDLFAGILSTRAAATLPIVIPEGKVVALDLNGYKITTPWDDKLAEKHYYAFENYGSLTIQDSSEGKNGEIIARGIFNYGTMTLESGSIVACDGNGGYGVRNYEGATFVMNGGSICTSNEDGDLPGDGYDATTLRVDNGAKATINGGTISNVSNYTFALDNYGEVVVKGGEIKSVHSTVSTYGTMTINGGSFTCNGLEGITAHALVAWDGSETTINGGTFDGKDNYNGFNVDACAGALVNIYGGKFLPVHSGSLYGEGTINVMGGEFFDNPSEFVNDDYTVVETENGLWTVVRKPDVAKIGEVGYTSLQKAVKAAQNGDTVLFVADVEQEDGVIITDKNITIDLNGNTFTVSNGASTNNRNFKVNGSSVVTIKNGNMVAEGDYSSGAYGTLRTEGTANVTLEGVKLYNYRGNGLNVKALSGTTVTINDTEIYSQYGGGVEAAGGTVELTNVKIEQEGMYTAPYNSMAISVNGGGTATVNSGTYSTECLTAEEANNQGTSHGPWCAGVLNSGGTLIIKGGTFSNDNFGDNLLATYARGLLLADTAANIQIEGGVFNAVKAIIDMTNNLGDASRNPSATISGGVFSADPRISGLYASHLISIAADYKVVEENGIWTVVVDPAAKIGETEYASLQEAFNVGGEITLLRDITIAETVVLAEGKTVVLDLNGKTLAAVDKNTIKNNGGNLTLKNGTVTRTGDVVGYSVNNASGEINVVDATVERGLYTSGSKMTATNANISHEQSSRHAIYAWDCEVTINSGIFHNDNAGNATLMASGSSVVTINGGTFSIADGRSALGWTSSMIDQNSTAQVIVKGGLFNGGFRINSADTTLTIEGGEFNTNNGSSFTDYSGTKVVKGGKFTDTGAQNWAKKYIAEGYEMNANGEVVAK